jgi:hypothetical protein
MAGHGRVDMAGHYIYVAIHSCPSINAIGPAPHNDGWSSGMRTYDYPFIKTGSRGRVDKLK